MSSGLYLINIKQAVNPLDPRQSWNFLCRVRELDKADQKEYGTSHFFYFIFVSYHMDDVKKAIKVWQSEIGGICVEEKSIRRNPKNGNVTFTYFHAESPDHKQKAEWELVDLEAARDAESILK